MKPTFWPGTKIVKSENNGFTGFSIHSTPFSSVHHFQSQLYRNWCSAVSSGKAPPPWPEFRDAAKKMARSHRPNGNGHAAVMPGLSDRAQKQLKAAPMSISIAPREDHQRVQKLRKATV